MKDRRKRFLLGLLYIVIGVIIGNYASGNLLFQNPIVLAIVFTVAVTALIIGIKLRK